MNSPGIDIKQERMRGAPIVMHDVVAPALSGMTHAQIQELIRAEGMPTFRARQLWAALHKRAVHSWDELTDLPVATRRSLAEHFRLRSLEVVTHLASERDGAEKALFARPDGGTVESVLIRGRNASGAPRLTVCVSSQVGCPAGCTFCATGLSGFMGNLTAPEIVDQVMYFVHAVHRSGERVGNVVFMGMGEPFLNPVHVKRAVGMLTDADGLQLGERHITVSTVGIVPQIKRFAEWGGQVNLAVSLHAPNDVLRSDLVPYNTHFPIESLMESVREYIARTRRRVSFEYVLLRDVNDSPELARELGALLRPFGGMAHVNLIPWNPFREGKFVRSEGADADAFAEVLRREGVNATIRYSKGLDISAACGQLREQVLGAAG
jgi:23S rRNA (adenine2503-C2)-methyltransferase